VGLAALERLAVDLAVVVDEQKVTLGGRALHGPQAGEPLAHPLQFRVDRVLRHLDVDLPDLQPAVGPQPGLRAHRDLDREAQRLALGGQRRDVELGVPHRGDPRVEQRPLVPLGQRLAQRLLHYRLATHPLHHHRRRDLALAKPRHPELASQAARGALEPAIDVGRLDVHVDAHARVRQLLDRGLHRVNPSY
jgi:hypothetical protein